MLNNLFVGGFPYETTQEQLAALFRSCGTVKNVKILVERQTGRSRGLGFVEMSSETEARAAIAKLNGSSLGPRKIFVSQARPPEKQPGAFPGKPGFVERRSGKDRRRASGAAGAPEFRRGEKPPAEEGRREGFLERKKKWLGKPSFTGKKEWKKRPPSSGEKPKEFGSKKKWGPGGPGGGNKWRSKPKKFGSGFRGPSGR